MIDRRPAIAVGLVGVALAVIAGVTAHAATTDPPSKLPRGDDPVTLDPADFSAHVNSRKWPMRVGSRWVYRVADMSDGSTQRDVITVTRRTKLIADGIRARVVHDVVRDHGVLLTEDFSPIEPNVSELKFYARGSGQAVLAIDVSGGSDREELIQYTR